MRHIRVYRFKNTGSRDEIIVTVPSRKGRVGMAGVVGGTYDDIYTLLTNACRQAIKDMKQ